ncbi:MAG: transporter, family, sugar:H+ symporter [Actinomycetota bacterium]|nr:transporter, family, sugar:H+ symporter [Actinomycetota bacterium]
MQGPVAAGSSTPTEKEPIHTGRVITIAVIAALGGFLFGYDSSVINGANKAVFYHFQITSSTLQGFAVAIALLGSALGAFVGGRLTDKFGRKKVMVTAAIMFLVAGVGQAFPIALWDFMFWRVIGGFAIGLAAVVSPMYISEVAPAHLRGRLSSLFQLAIVVGIFATQLVNQVIINLTPNEVEAPMLSPEVPPVEANNNLALGLEAWQWMFLCMVVPAVIYWVLSLTVPESPRYLVATGQEDKAKSVLEQIYVDDVTPKVTAIHDSLSGEHKMSMSDIKGPSLGLLPIVWVGIILAILQQFVGINAVFYYSNVIWAAIGFDESKAFFTSTIISLVNVIFTFVAIAFIDRVGRKPLLLIGSVGMFVTLLVLTITFVSAPQCTQALIDQGGTAGCTGVSEINTPLLSSTGGWIAVIMLNTYVAFFAATWGPIVWVLLGEMFPNRIRAAAMSIAVAANWLANYAVSQSFTSLIKMGLGVAYGLYTLGAFISIFYVWKFVKETKGVQLEDMEDLEGVKMKA